MKAAHGILLGGLLGGALVTAGALLARALMTAQKPPKQRTIARTKTAPKSPPDVFAGLAFKGEPVFVDNRMPTAAQPEPSSFDDMMAAGRAALRTVGVVDPTTDELIAAMVARPPDPNPPGTYRPGESETPEWLLNPEN